MYNPNVITKQCSIQWGSEILPFEIQAFWGSYLKWPVFKWPGFKYGYSYSPNHLKTRPVKIQMFFSGFRMVIDKMFNCWAFVHISNCWAARFQIPFETQPLFNHLKSRLVQISDPHCIYLLTPWCSYKPNVTTKHSFTQ